MGSVAAPSLSAEPLARAVVRPGGVWQDVRVVAETGSTNADLLAGGGAPSGSVLVAEVQTAGRGRQGRAWSSPHGTGLTFSVLLRPVGVEPARWSWLPLLAGMALATTVTRLCIIGVRLKWPNDLVCVAADGVPRKLAGILAERAGDAVAVGVGLNVSTASGQLPSPAATSLALEDSRSMNRGQLLITVLRELEAVYTVWQRTGGDPDASGARGRYRLLSATLDRQVRVELPGGEEVRGLARDVDAAGRLLVVTDSGEQPVSAGDVVHLR